MNLPLELWLTRRLLRSPGGLQGGRFTGLVYPGQPIASEVPAMPTYEYECLSCGRRFEMFQSITADPLEECIYEDCAPRGKVKRLLGTGAAVLFKGSGFYETDYRSASYQEKAKAESSKTSGSSDAGSKSDGGGGGSEGSSSSGSTSSSSTNNSSSSNSSE